LGKTTTPLNFMYLFAAELLVDHGEILAKSVLDSVDGFGFRDAWDQHPGKPGTEPAKPSSDW